MKQGFLLSAMVVVLLFSCSNPVTYGSFTPGEVEIHKTMYTVPLWNMTISLNVDKMIINNDYSVEIFCTWKTTWSSGTRDHVTKLSDDSNINMYLMDNLGNKYNHIRTTGAALEGCNLYYTSSASGTFVFPAINAGINKLVFRDDDQAGELVFDFY